MNYDLTIFNIYTNDKPIAYFLFTFYEKILDKNII